MIQIYEYKNCSTCQKALKFLDSKKVPYQRFAIVETPPSLKLLQRMLKELKAQGLNFRHLFNTSGMLYRELKIADQIQGGMTESEALELLAKNGKLIKRPFLLTDTTGTVGFKEDLWRKIVAEL